MPLRNFKPTVYIGPSMNPTLKAPDLLEIVSYEKLGRKIKVGDVIVFNSPEEKKSITHRVIEVSEKGVKTRGDNNRQVDRWWLQPTDIVGCVVAAKRGKRILNIYGGFLGHLRAKILHARLLFYRAFFKTGRPIYKKLTGWKIFPMISVSSRFFKIIQFNQEWGEEKQLLLFGYFLVGRRLPNKSMWRFRWPFGIFIAKQ